MTKGIDTKEAVELLKCEGKEVFDLLARAGKIRIENRGDLVIPCAIINAKSGNCGQNCSFCAQSSRSKATIETYPLLSSEKMFDGLEGLADAGAARVSIVTSGRTITSEKELDAIAEAIGSVAEKLDALPCASLGLLSKDGLEKLKAVGLDRYHHNLETAESFFSQICTTRQWKRSIETLEDAREIGLTLCCGGIFGLGESLEQRIELLESIRKLDTESVPINFLHPIPGTPLEKNNELTPMDCLKIVAVARLMMPTKEIRICGGREYNLRDLASWLLLAGADGIMIGGYLTTSGRTIDDDLQMIKDAGFRYRK